ncbi:MAG: hypothetical protein JJE52_15260 [Acidimicrobiia bacterium]|nr:hypothetical protein [Acidimicrobiia bacterium]
MAKLVDHLVGHTDHVEVDDPVPWSGTMADIAIWVSVLIGLLVVTVVVVRTLTRNHDPAPEDRATTLNVEAARGEPQGHHGF